MQQRRAALQAKNKPSLKVKMSVLATIAYCDQFAYPLTATEIWQRLIGLENDQLVSQTMIKSALQQFVRKNKLSCSGEWFFLPGREEVIKMRRRRNQVGQQKRAEGRRLVRMVSWIPWIRAIFVTGSAAVNNAEQEDDLDIMMVVQARRLWLTRLLVTGLAVMAGRRRSWHGEEPGSWCFNLWLDNNSLQIPPARRTLYQAYEVVQARPLFSRQQIVEKFWRENSWIGGVLPNWQPTNPIDEVAGFEDGVLSVLFSGIDWLCWRFQEWYMRSHRTSERTARSFAFFHPRNTRGLIAARWKSSLSRIFSAVERRQFQRWLEVLENTLQ